MVVWLLWGVQQPPTVEVERHGTHLRPLYGADKRLWGRVEMMEMYFRFCKACNCYEYDCHGLEGCIHHEPDYKPAHQRARERR